MIPAIGQPFKVTYKNYPEHFEGVIIRHHPKESYGYLIEQKKRTYYDAIGHPYTRPDDTIEVEANWFDTELTGRKITLL